MQHADHTALCKKHNHATHSPILTHQEKAWNIIMGAANFCFRKYPSITNALLIKKRIRTKIYVFPFLWQKIRNKITKYNHNTIFYMYNQTRLDTLADLAQDLIQWKGVQCASSYHSSTIITINLDHTQILHAFLNFQAQKTLEKCVTYVECLYSFH